MIIQGPWMYTSSETAATKTIIMQVKIMMQMTLRDNQTTANDCIQHDCKSHNGQQQLQIVHCRFDMLLRYLVIVNVSV